MKTRRIFVSLPADVWLTEQENELKWAIVKTIERLRYQAEIFTDPRGKRSLSGSLAWSAHACEEVMRRCEGCVVIGFPRWKTNNGATQLWLPTEYNHYEGAVAHTLNLPLLVLVQSQVSRRVVFDPNYRGYVGVIPVNATTKWLQTEEFKVPMQYWRRELRERRDIFLGYCGSSARTAAKLKRLLVSTEKLSVLDWRVDFDPATSILKQIELAAHRCGAGIFLFTRDDPLLDRNAPDVAVPRDNVVFEAGYFSALKGKSKVLIVREAGAKMPADLGGDIYANLKKKEDIDSIKAVVRKFLSAL